MNSRRFAGRAVLGLAITATVAACGGSGSGMGTTAPQYGALKMALTDAPFPSDSVRSVNVFVVRVDGRAVAADSTAADSATAGDSASAGGWTTLSMPDSAVDLLAYQNGNTLALGAARLAAGSYSGFRMVIDPTRSNVVLTNGDTLTGASSPGIVFPSGNRSGIKITLSSPVTIAASDTTTMLLDFNVADSFVLRGNSILQLGLLFTPVIQATIQ
ncbi:MAG: DUF4382 domain-containing protein [Gemmatimonadota bacterium]|nr:DUF4382 domain-containing protein [Gemmatimonadota bacterium]MDE3126685.1 DUF4382 domain-containing protein [Gemmatimonadota bacterium]MDE3174310.1 DUF4382 domain-containing protein [Gemmatimonadota bacterium]MDE3216285.1 DUF4382 domain-containing protein [Gemmatimonadota bacterium]